MNARDAARTALLDQADAAGRDAGRLMQAMAEHENTRVRHATPGPAGNAIFDRMRSQLAAAALAGHPVLCAHLSYQAPTVAFWLAYRPGKLRCTDCIGTAARAVRGTREDHRCDHCRRVVPTIYGHAAQLPAVVVDLAPLPLAALPPVQMQYGLCADCHRADLAAAGIDPKEAR